MAAGTLTTLDEALKNVYPEQELRNFFSLQHQLFSRIKEKADKRAFSGRKFIIGARSALNQAVGPLTEGATLHTRGSNDYLNMEVTAKYYYGVVGLSHQAISASRSTTGAFARMLDDNVMGTAKSLRQDMARDACYGAGFGELGRIAAGGVSGTTLTLETQPTVVGMPGSRFFSPTSTIESYTALSGGAAGASNRTVSSVSASASTIVVDANTGFTAGDYIFRQGGRGNAMMGLRGIVDSTTHVSTFQNLSRTTYPQLQAGVLANSGTLRAWTPELMDSLFSEPWNNGGGEWPTAAYSRLEIQQRAAAYIRNDRRADMKEMTLDNGYKTVGWTTPDGMKPWIVDQFCVPNTVMAVKEDDLFWAEQEPVQWEDGDGGGKWRFTDRTHTYEAWLYTYTNLCAWQTNNCSVLRDVSHTS